MVKVREIQERLDIRGIVPSRRLVKTGVVKKLASRSRGQHIDVKDAELVLFTDGKLARIV